MAEWSADFAIADYKAWIHDLDADRPRMLHMMLLVSDPDASLRFYRDGLGMTLLGGFEVEERRVSAYFVGYGIGAVAVELAHYWDRHAPIVTEEAGFRHVAIGVPDLAGALARVEGVGARVTMPPTVLVAGMPAAAFVMDPDGYAIELFQIRNR